MNPDRDKCWMVSKRPPCYVLGGRFGDAIQLLPCFLEIYRRTGMKPIVVCSDEYASIYDGVSYVQAHPCPLHWWKGIPEMKNIAQTQYGGGTVVQFWQELPKNEDTIGFNGRPWTTLQSHGHQHGVDISLDPDYGTSMARRCGFTQAEWMKLPLVFDRREKQREEALAQSLVGRRKPTVLFNFAGISSPFPYTPEVLAVIRSFSNQFHLVNVGSVKAARLYDLLALYDKSVLLITSDTSTAHLALGSSVPWVAYTVDGWCSTKPKGNVLAEIKYSKAREQLPKLRQILAQIAAQQLKAA